MTRPILWALIGLVVYGAWDHHKDRNPTLPTLLGAGAQAELLLDDAILSGKQSAPFELELRVFGYNRNNNSGNHHAGPLAFTSHILIAQPLSDYLRVVAREQCERTSAESAPWLQVIAANAAVASTLLQISDSKDESYKCARVGVRSFRWEHYLYQGEDQTERWDSGIGLPGNPHELLQLESISPIPCSRS